jgi:hypothetical protein
LVVVTVEVAAPEQLALSIVQVLWDTARVLNQVVLVQSGTVLNLYTWFPYTSHVHCDDVRDVVIINEWVKEEGGGFVRDAVLFPHKIPLNTRGSSIKVSTGYRNRLEGLFISEMFRSFNITLNYVSDVPLNKSPSDKTLTAVMDVVFGKSDVSYGEIPLVPDTVTLEDPSVPYYATKLGWFVPCHEPLSRLQGISRIFSVPVWVTMVIAFFLVSAASRWLANKFKGGRSFTSWSSSLYNTWAVTVGLSVTEMPRSIVLRLTLICFVWYCFAMSTVFQAFFTSYLVDPGYQTQLTTLEGILESCIEF